MKTTWQKFQPFNIKTSACFAPFIARAKDHPDTAAVFNAFGQVLDAATHRLLDWTPEEQADIKPSDAKEESPTVG